MAHGEYFSNIWSLSIVLFLPYDVTAHELAATPVDSDWNINLLAVDPCEGKKSELMLLQDYVIFKMGRSKYALNGTFLIFQDIEEVVGKSWDIHVKAAWQDGENTQTRREMTIVDLKETCLELNRGSESNWKDFFDSIVEPINRRCPIKKGTYTMRNYLFDVENAKGTLQEGIWYFTFEQTYNGFVSCVVCKILVTPKKQ